MLNMYSTFTPLKSEPLSSTFDPTCFGTDFLVIFWYADFRPCNGVMFWKTTPSWPSGVMASVGMPPVCPLPVVVPLGLECLESKGCRWPSLVLAVQVQHRWLILADFSFCEWIGTNLQQTRQRFKLSFFFFEIGGAILTLRSFFLEQKSINFENSRSTVSISRIPRPDPLQLPHSQETSCQRPFHLWRSRSSRSPPSPGSRGCSRPHISATPDGQGCYPWW